MQLSLSSPLNAAIVSKLELQSSIYDFNSDSIFLSYSELAEDNTFIASKNISLTRQQVTNFLDADVAGSTLRQSFADAFVGALTELYGPVTITSA